jgi:hypothetical protein
LNEIIENELTKNMLYKNNIILKYKIKYPQIGFTKFELGKVKFNEYYKKKAIDLQNYAENELYKMAVSSYEFSKQNDYPIMQYELVSQYSVTYNELCIVSIYSDQYIFSGGAHGNTIRSSQTWNLKKRDIISLSDLFPNDFDFKNKILKEINSQILYQISIGENYYFDNYLELLIKTFNPKNFYLTQEGIVIYYQQYDIAPYSSGIPTFVINYNKMPIRIPYCY